MKRFTAQALCPGREGSERLQFKELLKQEDEQGMENQHIERALSIPITDKLEQGFTCICTSSKVCYNKLP